jgi:transcriptional regulator with XRE-family HTH domain
VDTGKRFGIIVKRRRERAHLSQESLAHRASLHRTYISLLERGLRVPSIDVLRKLAVGLETTMTSLIREFEQAK